MCHPTSNVHQTETIEQEIPESCAGKRLDQALAALFPEFSRSRLKGWIEAGAVTVDGATCRARDRVLGRERVVLVIERTDEGETEAETIPLDIYFEDSEVVAVNKPPGLVVHPGAGNASGTLMNGLLHYDPRLAALPRAGLIHRLDKDTSGLLVIARTPRAHRVLTGAMEARAIQREYLAVCVGRLSGGGEVDAPIGRHKVDRKRMSVRSDGRSALTRFRLVRRYRGHTLIRVSLHTGRTHQIRVHMAHRRHPLLGDPVYGRPSFPRGATSDLRATLESFRRQALHAAHLEFSHPASGRPVVLEADPPADFRRLIAALDADAAARSDQ